MRIALVSIFDQGTHGHRVLSAVLKAAGLEVHNVYFGDKTLQEGAVVTERALQAVEHLLGSVRPDLVGLSVTSLLSHPAAAAVARRVKDRLDVPIAFGGPYPSLLPEFCVKNAPVDYVCVGEGEESVPELCARLAEGRSADDVPGIFSRRTLARPPRNPPRDLDALPFPDIDDDPNKHLILLEDGSIVPGDPALRSAGYLTKCSRNCPFNCSFCSAPNMRRLAMAKPLRRRSVARVIEELRRARERNPRIATMGFWDEVFPFDPTWVEEMAAEYERHIRLPFHVWAHPKAVRESNVAALARAGLQGVLIGIESASEVTRRQVYLRPESDEEIVRADALFAKHGVSRGYDLIVDHPWESPTEMEESFALLSRLQSPFLVNMHSLVLFPETELARRAIREGLAKDEEEITAGIFAELHEAHRRVLWTRDIPLQRDLPRAYWVFLLLCLGNPRIPTRLVTFLARRRIFRRHPELITDTQVLDMRKGNEHLGGYVLSLYRQSPGLGRILRAWPRLDRLVEARLLASAPLALASYLAHRMATRLPRILYRRLRHPRLITDTPA